MPGFIWTIILIFLLVWLITRIAAWLLVWSLERFLHISSSVNKVGFLGLKGVKIHLTETVIVEIEQAWLSSSLINRDVKKFLGICFSHVHLQGELPVSHHAAQSKASSKQKGKNSPLQSLNSFNSFLQHVGIHVFKAGVSLSRLPLEECCALTAIQDIYLRVDLSSKNGLDLSLTLTDLSTKISSSDQQAGDGINQSEYASFSGSVIFTLQVSPQADQIIQGVKLAVVNPHLSVKERFLLDLKTWSQERRMNKETTVTPAESRPQSVEKVLKNIPTICDLDIVDTELQLHSSSETCLKMKVQSVAIRKDENCGTLAVQGVTMLSDEVGLFNLVQTHMKTQISTDELDVSLEFRGMAVTYHYSHVQDWLNTLSTIKPEQSSSLHPIQHHHSQGSRSALVTMLSGRKINGIVDIMDSTLIVATDTCSGLKAGITQLKVTVNRPAQEIELVSANTWHAFHVDGELESLYCTLASTRLPPSELSCKQYHTDTLFYIGIALLQVSRTSSELNISSMFDSVQAAVSTNLTNVLSSLLGKLSEGLRSQDDSASSLSHPKSSSSPVSQKMHAAFASTVTARFNCENMNVFISNDYKVGAMLRIDSIDVRLKESEILGTLEGAAVKYLDKIEHEIDLVKSADLENLTAQIRKISPTINLIRKTVSIEIDGDVFFMWTTLLHMSLHQTLQDVQMLLKTLPKNSVSSKEGGDTKIKKKDIYHTTVTVEGNVEVSMQLSRGHRFGLSLSHTVLVISKPPVAPGTKSRSSLPLVTTAVQTFKIICDQHNIATVKGLQVKLDPHCQRLLAERETVGGLVLPSNRTVCVQMEQCLMEFPFQYNFAACFQEIVNAQKFVKLVHNVKKKPFTIDSTLPPDLFISVKTFTMQINDDPFEVKLGDNYELLLDEGQENEKRKSAMEKRIQELSKKHGLLSGSKVEELYASLSKRGAEVYIQRSKQLYEATPQRVKLFTWTVQNLEVMAMADTSMHGKYNAVRHMREIDPESPYPEDGLDFSTLWCRVVTVNLDKLQVLWRDFPQPALDVCDMHVWGKLVGAEQIPSHRATRTCVVEVGSPWSDVTVTRSMPSLKFYHDFSCDISNFTITYGACWEPTIAHFGLATNLISQPSVDPSMPMPIWDKLRLLIHGRLTLSTQRLRMLYHASLDPFNTSEMMEWTWTNLLLDWTNAKWLLKGDLDIHVRTASKYDDCRLLHLPNLRLCIQLDWLCFGDPNDHHSVMPCAPDKVPEYSMQQHDSFSAFRSQNLTLHLSLETQRVSSEGEGTQSSASSPSCVFYASTLRWIDKLMMCMNRVSRPIRRGKIFGITVPRKPQLMRHYKDVHIDIKLHEFEVRYWVSFAQQHGVEFHGGSFILSAVPQLTLCSVEDGLIHRKQADWSMQKFTMELDDVTVWLCSSQQEGDPEENIYQRGPVNKSYFLSVFRIVYQRREQSTLNSTTESITEEEAPIHKVQIYNLKGAWTRSNRNVAFSLYDGYQKAQAIKRSVSSDALKGFKVESQQTPAKTSRSMSMTGASSSGTFSPSPMTKIQSGPAYTMLQKLVAESDSKFVAVHEKMSEDSVQMEQLHGITACQTDDVVNKKWHIELYNGQVMLRGVETAGYVIVSAAKASILSCLHQPVWHNGQLRSKTTWVGSVDTMQYYGTVDPGPDMGADASEENILWVSLENIEDRNTADAQGIPEMVASGQSVGSVVVSSVANPDQTASNTTQLQRIISRCKCQFFYASYGDVENNSLSEVPLPPSEDSDMLKNSEEVADSFTMLHHDLNVCTNSLQYAMILDIVNNLMLYIEPGKKAVNDKLQAMLFQLQLSSVENQKTPILQKQNTLRKMVENLRQLERELYMVHKELAEDPENTGVLNDSQSLEAELYECKKQISNVGEELALMIRCFKESQLQNRAQLHVSKAKAHVTHRNEVCFKHAQWRLTDTDGQIGIADLVLRNFLYTKMNKDDDSGQHQLELGWVKVTNLLPNTPYKDVLVPQESQSQENERQVALRIFTLFKAPVGGIAVREHLEVNVVPLAIQLTYQFFKTMMKFFFPDRNIDTDEADDEDVSSQSKAKKKEDRKSSIKRSDRHSADDIDKMRERAANNTTFLYIKIPDVPLKVSYKGEKDKNIEDVRDFSLLLPTIEYHNQTITWLDLLMAVKSHIKKELISQAIKQKLHMKSRSGVEAPPTDVQQEEDKAKMLLGAKLLGAGDKLSSKKSLFGKSSKHS